MKIISILLSALLLSCSTGYSLKSVDSGPRAKIIFSAPQLDDRSTVDVVPSLQMLESNDDCSFSSLGRVSLSLGSSRGDSYVPANERVYFKVQHMDDSDRLADIDQQVSFSFVPEEDREYLIEQLGSPTNLRIRYYVIEDDGTGKEIKVQGLGECK